MPLPNKTKRRRIRQFIIVLVILILRGIENETVPSAFTDSEKLLIQLEADSMMDNDAGGWGTGETEKWGAACDVFCAIDEYKNSEDESPSLTALETANDALDALLN